MPRVAFKKKIFIALVVYAVIQISYLFLIRNSLDIVLLNAPHDTRFPQEKRIQPFKYDPLLYIPHSTVSVWSEKDFLVVLGIPSLDIPKRQWRRHMQRTTCWQFPEVATRDNNYTGAMLVLYVLARHPINNFVLSDGLVQESEQWHDVLVSPMNEGLSDTNKIKIGKGYWGTEAEIGSSRKTFIWFQMALLMFPRVPYLAKSDDDMFLRVPQYLSDLRRLPINKTYWGRLLWTKRVKNRNGDLTKPFMFASGLCYTMSRDVAQHVTAYEPLRKMVWVPYRKERLIEFRLLGMEHEDLMVGQVIYETQYPTVYVREPIDRFHFASLSPVTDSVVVKHTPKEQDYYTFMTHFTVNGTTKPDTVIFKKNSMVFKMLSPKQQIILVKNIE